MMANSAHRRDVGRYGKVSIVPLQNRGQPATLLVDGCVTEPPQPLNDPPHSRPFASTPGLSHELEMAAPAFTPTDVREPQEVERFRAAEAGALSVPGHEAAKSDPDRVKTRRGLVRYPNFLKIIDFRLDMPIRHGIGVQTAL